MPGCVHGIHIWMRMSLFNFRINNILYRKYSHSILFSTLHANIARNWDADAAEKMLREVCTYRRRFRNINNNLLCAEIIKYRKLPTKRVQNWEIEREREKLHIINFISQPMFFFLQSMKWRERWNVDNILDWKTPQALDDYSPHGISGFDKEGSPSNFTYRLSHFPFDWYLKFTHAFPIFSRMFFFHAFFLLFMEIFFSTSFDSFRFDWFNLSAVALLCSPPARPPIDAVIVVPFAGMDMWGMLHTVSRADFIRSTIKVLEKYMKLAFEQSVTHGPQARQFVVLFDMAGFNVKQYTWRPGNVTHWQWFYCHFYDVRCAATNCNKFTIIISCVHILPDFTGLPYRRLQTRHLTLPALPLLPLLLLRSSSLRPPPPPPWPQQQHHHLSSSLRSTSTCIFHHSFYHNISCWSGHFAYKKLRGKLSGNSKMLLHHQWYAWQTFML